MNPIEYGEQIRQTYLKAAADELSVQKDRLPYQYAAAVLSSLTWVNLWLSAITALLGLLVWRQW